VIALYYNEDLTMKEVGGVLGLTESRVSQLHSQAMLRLKRYLLGKLASDESQA
jgi:RNA polymerase sigma factor for flagellar operon FliA